MQRVSSKCLVSPALTAAAVCGLIALHAPDVRAQSYPDGTIKIVSMHPPGSVTDVLARPLAQSLTASLGQPVIVENRPGANGVIATGMVAKTPPDAYTLLITSGSH